MAIAYRCSECGEVATQGVDEQGGEGALHCAAHPSAVVDSVVVTRRPQQPTNMTSTTDATVTDYSTGDTLDGAASDALVLASLRAHPEGAVRASLRGGEWVPDETGTHTVYTSDYTAMAAL